MTFLGGCLCGAVRYQADGEPFRIGICHCADCRKESGSSFTSFAHWRRDAFTYSGEISHSQVGAFARAAEDAFFA